MSNALFCGTAVYWKQRVWIFLVLGISPPHHNVLWNSVLYWILKWWFFHFTCIIDDYFYWKFCKTKHTHTQTHTLTLCIFFVGGLGPCRSRCLYNSVSILLFSGEEAGFRVKERWSMMSFVIYSWLETKSISTREIFKASTDIQFSHLESMPVWVSCGVNWENLTSISVAMLLHMYKATAWFFALSQKLMSQ